MALVVSDQYLNVGELHAFCEEKLNIDAGVIGSWRSICAEEIGQRITAYNKIWAEKKTSAKYNYRLLDNILVYVKENLLEFSGQAIPGDLKTYITRLISRLDHKYPPVDCDMTEIEKKQAIDGVVVNVKKQLCRRLNFYQIYGGAKIAGCPLSFNLFDDNTKGLLDPYIRKSPILQELYPSLDERQCWAWLKQHIITSVTDAGVEAQFNLNSFNDQASTYGLLLPVGTIIPLFGNLCRYSECDPNYSFPLLLSSGDDSENEYEWVVDSSKIPEDFQSLRCFFDQRRVVSAPEQAMFLLTVVGQVPFWVVNARNGLHYEPGDKNITFYAAVDEIKKIRRGPAMVCDAVGGGGVGSQEVQTTTPTYHDEGNSVSVRNETN